MPDSSKRHTAALAFALLICAGGAAQAQVSADMRAQAMALAKVCRADFERLCAGVAPGGGRVLACLQSHSAGLSAPCLTAMPKAQALKTKAAAAGVLPK